MQNNFQISSLWKNIEEDYQILKLIGVGSFGEVIKARQKTTNTIVAIKLVKNIFSGPYKIRQIIGEIQILRHLTQMKSNKFTTKLYDIIICQDHTTVSPYQFSHLFMIMEYMESDLRKILDKIPDQVSPFSPDHIVNLIYNVLCAINFLHTAGVMHRDIKPANILVNHDCSIRLCDFGLSRTVPNKRDHNIESIKQQFKLIQKRQKNDLDFNPTKKVPSQIISKNSLNPVSAPISPMNHMDTLSVNEDGRLGQGFKKLISYLKTIDFASEEVKISTASTSPSKTMNAGVSHTSFKIPAGDMGKFLSKKDSKQELITKQRQSIAQYLHTKHPKNNPRKRNLSNHVISRWYRAPEIIFIEKSYDQTVDLWSTGCILSDMINCCQPLLSQRGPSDVRQRCLFKGNSCFPLSPKRGENDQKSRVISSGDQIIKIMEIIPKLTSDDMSFISDSSAIDYVNKLKLKNDETRLEQHFKELISGKLQDYNDLYQILTNLLQFNPYFRFSAKECLQFKIFDKVRVKSTDFNSTPLLERSAPYRVDIPVFHDGAFNYETGESERYTMENFQEILIEEILTIKNMDC